VAVIASETQWSAAISVLPVIAIGNPYNDGFDYRTHSLRQALRSFYFTG
jgi:hypothetical protein